MFYKMKCTKIKKISWVSRSQIRFLRLLHNINFLSLLLWMQSSASRADLFPTLRPDVLSSLSLFRCLGSKALLSISECVGSEFFKDTMKTMNILSEFLFIHICRAYLHSCVEAHVHNTSQFLSAFLSLHLLPSPDAPPIWKGSIFWVPIIFHIVLYLQFLFFIY